jgi:hypothetical protein
MITRRIFFVDPASSGIRRSYLHYCPTCAVAFRKARRKP